MARRFPSSNKKRKVVVFTVSVRNHRFDSSTMLESKPARLHKAMESKPAVQIRDGFGSNRRFFNIFIFLKQLKFVL